MPHVLQVRYNAVRRQTAAKRGEKELQVLDYQNTSADLLPLVASSYALIFMVGHACCHFPCGQLHCWGTCWGTSLASCYLFMIVVCRPGNFFRARSTRV